MINVKRENEGSAILASRIIEKRLSKDMNVCKPNCKIINKIISVRIQRF